MEKKGSLGKGIFKTIPKAPGSGWQKQLIFQTQQKLTWLICTSFFFTPLPGKAVLLDFPVAPRRLLRGGFVLGKDPSNCWLSIFKHLRWPLGHCTADTTVISQPGQNSNAGTKMNCSGPNRPNSESVDFSVV